MAQYPATIELDSLDGNNGFKITGANTVSPAGDMNGDGFADMIVSDPAANGGAGASWVVFGRGSSFGAVLDGIAIDTNSLPGGNQALVLVAGGGAFTAAGQGRAVQAGAHTLLQLNTNAGTATVEMVIQLSNVTAGNINPGDFVL